MAVQFTDYMFHDSEHGVHIVKGFPDGKQLYCHVVFQSEKFIDYQRDLFEDFLWNMVDVVSDEESDLDMVKRNFEQQLQDLNTKLLVFAEKIEDVTQFPIKWIVQLFSGTEYIASLIGATGVMVLRDERLNYMMSNQIDDQSKIPVFSELIEGEVREFDEIIVLGTQVTTYIDKSDIATVYQVSRQEQKTFVEALLDLLDVRVSREETAFVSHAMIQWSKVFSQKNVERKMKSRLQDLKKVKQFFLPYQNYLTYALLGLIILVLVYRVVQSFLTSNEARFVETNNGVVVDFTIEDIQKDIARFKRMDASSNEKIKTYNEILAQLDLLEEHNRWANDVAELRKILESEYFKWFNIVLANNDSIYGDQIYSFSQQEKNIFNGVNDIFYTDSLMIWGNEWVLLGAINDELRWTLVSASTDMSFDGCTMNLLKNGLYCHTNADQIYNIVKGWQVNVVTNASWPFPSNIQWLWTFGSSNFYALTNDALLNQAGTYIVRYTNQLGTQEAFGEWTEYILVSPISSSTESVASGTASSSVSFSSSGFASFSIDGTFLTWSPTERKVYQLRRADASSNLQSREIPLRWWDTIEEYSPNTRVIASIDSRFVYLFDKDNQTFTVYRSTPFKTNDANTYTYTLEYFFRFKFSVTGKEVIDVFVDEGERSSLYLLTNDAVHNIKLYDYINTYFQKAAEEAQQ